MGTINEEILRNYKIESDPVINAWRINGEPKLNYIAAIHADMRSAAKLIESLRADASRYQFLCANPDWHFVERIMRCITADDSAQFKAALDAALDAEIAGKSGYPKPSAVRHD